jgi:hypothetical protein
MLEAGSEYRECKWGENGLYVSNVEIIAISEIYEVCMSYSFVSEDQIPDLSAVIVGQVRAERNISLLYNVEQRNDNYDAVLPVEGRERLGIFDKIYFIETFAENTFSE